MIGDQIDRTATQVRVPGAACIHRLYRAHRTNAGQVYSTTCGEQLSNVTHRAVLTTAPASCSACAAVSALSTMGVS